MEKKMKQWKQKTATLALMVIFVLAAMFAAGCGQGAGSGSGAQSGQDSQKTSGQESDQGSNAQAGATTYPLQVTDGLGNAVIIEKEPQRVISLSPANTEILFALGVDSKIKGRTDYCSYPAEAAQVASIGTYTSPNTELMISMEPDVIFASDYIDDNIRKQMEATGAKVVVISANSVKSTEDAIAQMGKILNANEKAAEIVSAMEADLKDLQDKVASAKEKKSVFVDLGMFYSAGPGSLLDDMLSQINVANIAADTEETWPQLSVEAIIEKNPDFYLSLFTTPDELKQTTGVKELDCIKNGNIIFYEGLSEKADMIQRPGPRVVEGIRILAGHFYPGLF